jgi:hypothetical protein
MEKEAKKKNEGNVGITAQRINAEPFTSAEQVFCTVALMHYANEVSRE